MQKILSSLLQRYEGSDWLLFRKAKTLMILNLVVILIIAIQLLVSSLLIRRLVPEFYSNSTIGIIMVLSVILLKQGKFEFASVLTIIAITGGITWTRYGATGHFSSDISYDFTQYVLDLVIVIFYAKLIAIRRNLIGLVFVLVLLLLGAYAYILPRYFNDVAIHPYTNNVFISGFAFFIIAGLIGWFNFQQTKIAVETAKRGEQRYHSLFENAQDAIFIIQGDRFIECNPKTLLMFGCPREEIIGKTPYHFSPKSQSDGMDSEEKAHQLIHLAINGTPQRFDWQHVRMDGSSFDADVSLNRLELTGEIVLLAIVRDISEKKQLEKEVYISYIKGEESERTRVAKDIHDGLGPLLSACKIYHYNLGTSRFKKEDLHSYNKLGMLLNESMQSVKEISNNLSPHILRNFGLTEAVKSFTGNIKTDIKIDIQCICDLTKRYDELIEVTLYRVIIELIHNSLKHSDASEVMVLIEETDNVLRVAFHDNGKGFDYAETTKESGGFGLLNIQSRIHSLGGTIGFETGKDKGVKVNIMINL